MKLTALALTSALAAMATCGAAQAATYDFTFVGTNFSITDGVFTTGAENADGSYKITSASGDLTSMDSSQPSGLFSLYPGAANGSGSALSTSDGLYTYSNVYTPGNKSFNDAGLMIEGAEFEANLYNGVNANYSACSADCLSAPGGAFYNPGDLGVVTITAVSEPAAWALMLTGFGLAGLALRRKAAAAA